VEAYQCVGRNEAFFKDMLQSFEGRAATLPCKVVNA
jgi:hypothetical protein